MNRLVTANHAPRARRLAAAALAAAALAASLAQPSTAQPASAPRTPPPANAADAGLQPFTAHYVAQWKNIDVGSSDLTLVRGTAPQRYVYTWRIRAGGIFRLIYRHDVVQKSWLQVDGPTVRPLAYEAQDGDSRIHLDFDWGTHRATGTMTGKPVDLELKDGTQDLMSIQIQVMQDLRAGHLPATFWIIDKDQIKDFDYRRTGDQRIATALGELDTIVVTSRRPDGDRVLTMWFAPSLNYVPVRAVRTRGGKLEFEMRIRRFSR